MVRDELILIDGTSVASTDWSVYRRRVEELLRALIASAAAASCEPAVPFLIGVAHGAHLAHVTSCNPSLEQHGPFWKSELERVAALLAQGPVGIEPGVLALQSLSTGPLHRAVFVAPSGSRSLEPRVLGHALSGMPGFALEVLVVPDGALTQPVTLQTDLILLQASHPLQVSLLEEGAWAWSARRLVERQQTQVGLELGDATLLTCVARPSVLATETAQDLRACVCHSAMLDGPRPAAPSLGSGQHPPVCPRSKLPLDNRDIYIVGCVGCTLWPASLAPAVRATNANMMGPAPGVNERALPSIVPLSRIRLERVPLTSLYGEPWLVTADPASLHPMAHGLFQALASKLHESKQGIVCRIRAGDAASHSSLASRPPPQAVLLPQGPPHLSLVLKAFVPASQLPSTPPHALFAAGGGGQDELPAQAKEQVASALAQYGIDDFPNDSPVGDGAKVAAMALRSDRHYAPHPVASSAGDSSMRRSVGMPLAPAAPPPPHQRPQQYPEAGSTQPAGAAPQVHQGQSLMARTSRPSKRKMPRISLTEGGA